MKPTVPEHEEIIPTLKGPNRSTLPGPARLFPFAAFGMSSHQKPPGIRQPDRDVATLAGIVVGVGGCSAQEISKHRSGLVD
jgi:hypothetical protein